MHPHLRWAIGSLLTDTDLIDLRGNSVMATGILSSIKRLFKKQHRPPNVVWICADDFNPSVSGAYGNALASTPNLDRLAAEGIRFDRAYCTCPLSTPSRMAFLTGRYPCSTGVRLTPTPLPQDEVIIASYLRAARYKTFASGKTHYYDPLGHHFDRSVDLPEHEAHLQSVYPSELPPGTNLLGRWRPFREPASGWLNADGRPFAFDSEMPDTFFTDQAVQFLKQRHDRPFFLWVGFYVTHAPFRFPVEFQGRFRPDQFSVPEVSPEDIHQIPKVFQELTDSEKQGIIAAYYTSVTYMDRNLGRILDGLKVAGLEENTLVIFNSDHGYLLGQHGRFEKHCCYEEAVRSALVCKLPGVIPQGCSNTALVELIDILPTILDFCTGDVPEHVHGQSLKDLVKRQKSEHRHHVISEYGDNAEAMVRTDRWKLIYSAGNRARRDGYAVSGPLPGPSTKLFDLWHDPEERFNVADLPENVPHLEELLTLLTQHMRSKIRDRTLAQEQDPISLLAQCLPASRRSIDLG